MPSPAALAFNKRILIAEANEHHARQIHQILSQHGFSRLESAGDGKALTKLLQQAEPCDIGLLILSLELEDCDIVALCRSLADEESEYRIPVIVLFDPKRIEAPHIKDLTALQGAGVILVEKPIRAQEFLPLVQLSLILKHERDRTLAQQEKILTELAEHKILEARLKYLILHDELTGVGNRRQLEQTLQLALHRCQAYKQPAALLYLDIDRFNVINDLEGHDSGDRLLVELVNVIRQQLTGKYELARIGADEFCLYLPNCDRSQALATGEKIRRAVESFRFLTSNDCYHISISVGIALLEPGGPAKHPNELLAQAHQACYIAKTRGRNLVNLYDPEDMTATHFHDVQWVPLIREALRNDRFFLVFQPVIRLSDGLVSHYEVLLRLRREDGEILTPDRFIPVAERMGLIHAIDLWVVEHAIDFLAGLPNTQSHLALTVNLSGHAFQNRQLLPLLEEKLKATWVPAKRLIFEITETATITNFERTREMIAKLGALGCRFALDDFGTGFNSFEHLKNIPVHYIKIDGQFVLNPPHDPTDRMLVEAMVKIAHNLGKQVIAEFVETPEMLQLLHRLGVDYAQGFLMGKPEPQLLPGSSIPLQPFLDSNPRQHQLNH
ncbi:hypothetical protein MIT9_P1767 [Methylomarinovum caldicuralii]|uniref:GGDEF domain-containing response regulator n=1 Tax=Methylomarinovum caldicuralii TaxID=438856 RepID=A0AAU9CRM3_9GAMM|nr:EAL domain-containing protein [Methylomarinovum caldicuralii]BCX82182.1 hypothetical protein MIT9_P1767 [Methylomarinovum caldicuralii]